MAKYKHLSHLNTLQDPLNRRDFGGFFSTASVKCHNKKCFDVQSAFTYNYGSKMFHIENAGAKFFSLRPFKQMYILIYIYNIHI